MRWQALADAARDARSPAKTHALAALAVVSRKLREAQDELAHLTSAEVLPALVDRDGPEREEVEPVRWTDVEADLED